MIKYILAALLITLAGCESSGKVAGNAQANLARSSDPAIQSTNNLEIVHTFFGPMPTGVTVSQHGRIFICYPRWGDAVQFTVGEVKNDQVVAYPDPAKQDATVPALISVQSVVVDPQDRLWLLETGSIKFGPIQPGAAKMLCFDLQTDKLVKTIVFPPDVALPTTYVNDVRFNLNMGKAGTAFITDSSDAGPNGIIVVDLDSGTSWRKLSDHASTKAGHNFVPTVEGKPLMAQPTPQAKPENLKLGSDGIALSPDGKTLYYCPLAGRHVFSVSTAALADRSLSDSDTAGQVVDLGQRDFGSDGLMCDPQGNLLLTDYEHNAVRRLDGAASDPKFTIIAQDPRLIWPDTMAIHDGWLYVTANQLDRQARYHGGVDQRQQPYVLFRFKLPTTRSAGGAS